MTVYDNEIDENNVNNSSSFNSKSQNEKNPVFPKEVTAPDPDKLGNSSGNNASKRYENQAEQKSQSLEQALVLHISKNLENVVNPEGIPVSEESQKWLNSLVHDVLKKVVADL
jgi:hypothetical protein